MRRAILVGLASLSLAALALAQRGAVAPAIPAAVPAPAIHAMPGPAVGAHAPVASAGHVPVAGNHLASPHGPAHPVSARPANVPPKTGSHGSAPARSNALPRKASNTSGFPVNPIAPTAPTSRKPFIPGFLPPDAFTGQSCFLSSNCYPVPGFGFDYEHFFAVHPNWGKFHPVSGVVVPAWGGGFYYPVPYYTESTPQEEQEENAAAQDEEEHHLRGAAPAYEEPAPTSTRSGAPYIATPPVEEYVFVKRDGTRIFAVAYSLAKDKLQYVTKEGLRRTLPLEALDYDATMKSNEERGNTVTLPGAPPAAMAMAR